MQVRNLILDGKNKMLLLLASLMGKMYQVSTCRLGVSHFNALNDYSKKFSSEKFQGQK